MLTTEDPSTAATEPSGTDRVSPGRRPPRRGRVARETNRWSRLAHVYASMIAFVIILFFGLTGITLNHPDWTFGDETNTTTVSGQLPMSTTFDDGSTDFLSISEYMRDEFDVNGSVDSFSETNGRGTIAYTNPGYAADVFFDIDTGAFDLTVEQQGWVAVVNDLHKGRDTGSAWKWVIDLSAGFLVLVSLTGLTMQLFLRKRRRSSLVTLGVGAALVVVAVIYTLS